jgi:hypothetical protein
MCQRAAPILLFWRQCELHALFRQGFVSLVEVVNSQGDTNEPAYQRLSFGVAGLDQLDANARPAKIILGPANVVVSVVLR